MNCTRRRKRPPVWLNAVPLKLQSDGAAKKGGERRHCVAGGDESRHEVGPADLAGSKIHGGTNIAKLEISHEFVVGRETAGRALELGGIVPVKKFADCPPFFGTRHNGVSDLEESRRLGVPQTGTGQSATV